MSDIEFLQKYEELLDKDYCNCNEMNCIDNNSPRRILNIAKELHKENQKLKKQLEEERKKVSEYSYKLSNFRCEETYETQQKEFIEYLEDMLVSELDIFTVVRVCDVLSKYKEIIGGK